ncbi:glycoside hydrolase family 27 [Purpureocillium lavendulum]|uniref:Glycoside hydrolase family 27 n=1 Tax=Purpureocillium lavendulum TaxID=1247861 RepID=A0AB34FK78_9HYPO|nr:glycoside hydrolase family 27 [Purpureocillium lavendulum]
MNSRLVVAMLGMAHLSEARFGRLARADPECCPCPPPLGSPRTTVTFTVTQQATETPTVTVYNTVTVTPAVVAAQTVTVNLNSTVTQVALETQTVTVKESVMASCSLVYLTTQQTTVTPMSPSITVTVQPQPPPPQEPQPVVTKAAQAPEVQPQGPPPANVTPQPPIQPGVTVPAAVCPPIATSTTIATVYNTVTLTAETSGPMNMTSAPGAQPTAFIKPAKLARGRSLHGPTAPIS